MKAINYTDAEDVLYGRDTYTISEFIDKLTKLAKGFKSANKEAELQTIIDRIILRVADEATKLETFNFNINKRYSYLKMVKSFNLLEGDKLLFQHDLFCLFAHFLDVNSKSRILSYVERQHTSIAFKQFRRDYDFFEREWLQYLTAKYS